MASWRLAGPMRTCSVIYSDVHGFPGTAMLVEEELVVSPRVDGVLVFISTPNFSLVA